MSERSAPAKFSKILPRYHQGQEIVLPMGVDSRLTGKRARFVDVSVIWSVFTTPAGRALNYPEKPTVNYRLDCNNTHFDISDVRLAYLMEESLHGYMTERLSFKLTELNLPFAQVIPKFKSDERVLIDWDNAYQEVDCVRNIRVLRVFKTSSGGEFQQVLPFYQIEYYFGVSPKVSRWVYERRLKKC